MSKVAAHYNRVPTVVAALAEEQAKGEAAQNLPQSDEDARQADEPLWTAA